jgi:PadR family transcriptional regulator, regulatory protein PadR
MRRSVISPMKLKNSAAGAVPVGSRALLGGAIEALPSLDNARTSTLQYKDPCVTLTVLPIDGLATQLRKGVIEYCVLAMLKNEPLYGGEVIQMLRSRGQLLVSEGTIYPLLSRMRSEGLVETEWRDTPGGAPRRYYRLSRSGQKAVNEFRDEWFRFRDSVDGIFRDGGKQG